MPSIWEWIGTIDRWFFDYQVSSVHLALMRIGCVATIAGYLFHQRNDLLRFMAPDGPFSETAWNQQTARFPQIALNQWFPNNRKLPQVVFTTMMISGFCSLTGLITQFSLIVFLLCVISIQSRAFLLLFSGGDSVARMVLLCLILSDSGATWSVDAWLRSQSSDLVSGWPMRLLQIYVCTIYWNATRYKIHMPCWTRGHAARDAAMSGLWSRRIEQVWFKSDLLSIWASRSVLFFEATAPFTFWIRELTLPTFFLGVILHAGVWIFLRIGYFGPIMIVALFSFAGSLFPS
jgi:hypothetical protein